MPTKHCSWGKCNSDSRYSHKDYMQGVTFSTIPDLLADPNKHKRWIHLCGRADLTTKSTHDPSKARWQRFICSKHFVGGNGPTELNSDPLPASYTQEQIEKAVKAARTNRRRKASPDNGRHCKKSKLADAEKDDISDQDNVEINKTDVECSIAVNSLNSNALAPSDKVNTVTVSVQTDQFTEGKMENLRLKTELLAAQNEISRLKLEVARLNLSLKQPLVKLSENTDVLTQTLSVSISKSETVEKKPKSSSQSTFETSQSTSDDCDGKKKTKIKQRVHKINNNGMYLYDTLARNPKMFEYFTGISLENFTCLWTFIEKATLDMKYQANYKEERVCKNRRLFSKKDELVFTLIRLRRGKTLKEMSYEIGVSETYFRSIFNTWVRLLYDRFSSLRSWMFASLEEVALHTPASMKGQNVRCIIDCTELSCHQPKHFGKNGNRYSAYKGRTTFKVLVAIAPAGYICYISEAYEGSISVAAPDTDRP